MKQELKQLADISGHKILGNPNSERGNIQEIDMGFGLSFSGGTVSVDLELNDLIDVTTNFPLNPTEADDGKMLFYDHSIGEWTTGDAVTHGTVVINGKKASAGTISKGLPVYLVGFDADLHTVELANTTSGSTMPVIGFTAENMNSTNSKHIITFGKLTGINTTSTVTTLNPNGETWVVNDALYMSTTTGGLTKVKPTGGTTSIQRIAKVLRVHSTGGQLFIYNTAHIEGLPNLTTNKLWMGNNNGQPIEIGVTGSLSLSGGNLVGTDTYIDSGSFSDSNLVLSRTDEVDVTIPLGFNINRISNYIDIQPFISGYTLTDNDTGKLFSNSMTSGFRSLNIPTGLTSSTNSFQIKGRVSITPGTGVNVDVPGGNTITNGVQFSCEEDTYYILHKKEFSGNNWVLNEINSNMGGGGGDSLYTANGTIGSGRVATITDTLTFAGGTVSMSNQRIVSVLDPVNNQDVSTKFYTDSKDIQVFSGTSSNSLNIRKKYRTKGYLKATDDNVNQETVIELDETQLTDFNSTDIIDVNGVFKLSLDTNKLYFGNIQGLAEQKTLNEVFDGSTTIVGTIFIIGVDNKLQLNVPQGYIIRGNVNGEGVAEPLISGSNKTIITDNNGDEVEADLVSFLDLLTATTVTSNNVLNTTDLSGTARGVLGGWKITDIVVKNTTANVVTINIGSSPGGTDVVNGAVIPANGFVSVPIGTSLFSETVEQSLNVSSGNWSSANLTIKISVKKVY